MKKLTAIILVLVMLVPMCTAGAFGAEEKPSLEVAFYNVSFGESVYPKWAIAAENADKVELLVWLEEKTEYTYGTQDVILQEDEVRTIQSQLCHVFTYTGLKAKQMTDNIYVRAYTEKGGEAYYSKLSRYSILDYAYSIQGKTGTASADEALVALMKEMLEYGAAVQTYKKYHTERLATDTYYQVKVSGGTVNGTESGLFKTGTSVKLSAPAKNSEGASFTRWEKDGVSVGTAAEMNITVGEANVKYAAKYEAEETKRPDPTEELEISVDGDEATVEGFVEDGCEDTFIVIPEKYNNVPVTTIGASAFAGEEFTSIFIPLSVTSIEKKAFNSCDVTDVYYEGTAEQWSAIEKGTYNAALNDAVKHYQSFGPVAPDGFTVTFKDYNGDVLDTQTVAEGASATAPADPERSGWTFIRWDKLFTNVTEDMDVTAEYVEGTDPVIVVGNAEVKAGETVEIPVYLCNTIEFSALSVEITYDEDVLTLSDVVTGSATEELGGSCSYTQPGILAGSGCRAVWRTTSQVSLVGEMFILKFIASDSASGSTEVSVSPITAKKYDGNAIKVSNVKGTVTVQ